MIPNWHQQTVINIISSTDSTLLQNYTVVRPRSISNNQFYSLTRLCKAGERQASKVLYWTHLYFGSCFIWIPFVPNILHTRQQLLCAMYLPVISNYNCKWNIQIAQNQILWSLNVKSSKPQQLSVIDMLCSFPSSFLLWNGMMGIRHSNT